MPTPTRSCSCPAGCASATTRCASRELVWRPTGAGSRCRRPASTRRRRSTGTAAGTGRPFYYFAYGAAVQRGRGRHADRRVRVERVDILHDCGTSLNPAIDIGQIEGGFVQGMGWLTTEELWCDGQGRLRTPCALAPTRSRPAATARASSTSGCSTAPNREDTIYRSKAVGEPPLMLAISVLHAISRRGGQRRRSPLLPASSTHRRRPSACCDAIDALARACGGMNRSLAPRLRDLLAAGVPVVLVEVAVAKGSTPREAGAAMLVTAERLHRHDRWRPARMGARWPEARGLLAGGRAQRACSSCRSARPSASAAAAM